MSSKNYKMTKKLITFWPHTKPMPEKKVFNIKTPNKKFNLHKLTV